MLPAEGAVEECEEECGAIILLENRVAPADREKCPGRSDQDAKRILDTGEKGILLVEHDMALVMKICGYIHVLDFGQPIFEGAAEQVRCSELVRAAYLGTEEVEEAVLGREPSPASRAG